MTAAVRMSAALPTHPDHNGLDSLAHQLASQPHTIVVAVLWLDTKSVTTDTDTGTHIPTVRIRRIEPVGDVTDVPDELRRIVDAAVEVRTGRVPLPFTEVDEVE